MTRHPDFFTDPFGRTASALEIASLSRRGTLGVLPGTILMPEDVPLTLPSWVPPRESGSGAPASPRAAQ